MFIFSNELYLSIILSLVGFFSQFQGFIRSLQERKQVDCNLWNIILSRYFYDKNGYLNLILVSFSDFYITILLFVYITFMLLKFVGIHFSKNKKITGHYWNDIIFIVSLCFFTRIISSYL